MGGAPGGQGGGQGQSTECYKVRAFSIAKYCTLKLTSEKCGEMGHIARNCTRSGGFGNSYGGGGGPAGYGGGGAGGAGKTCYSCGGYGHMSRKYPLRRLPSAPC